MKINYSHLCEKAFLSQNGNLNLIGVFEKVAAKQFPVSFPQLSIVSSIEAEIGQHQLMIKIVNTESGEEATKAISINLNVQAPKEGPVPEKQNLRIIGDINNLTIKAEGKYEVQISLNGESAYTIPFSAEIAKKPIPEGR